MNQQESKVVKDFVDSLSKVTEMLTGNLKEVMNNLPKEHAEKIADEIKKADLTGKTDKIREEIQSLNKIFK